MMKQVGGFKNITTFGRILFFGRDIHRTGTVRSRVCDGETGVASQKTGAYYSNYRLDDTGTGMASKYSRIRGIAPSARGYEYTKRLRVYLCTSRQRTSRRPGRVPG